MGKGERQAGVLGAGEPAIDPRGPVGLNAGSNAAQALPPPVAEFKDTSDKRPYSWLEGKAQLLLCRVASPKPDFSWTLKKIRQETKDKNQLGFTDCSFESENVANPKAEAAGYFAGRSALKVTAIRIPKELNVTDAQVKTAEGKKDNEAEVKRLKALQACRDHLVTHELKHVEKAWDSLSNVSLGWELKLGTLGEGTTVTEKHISDALDEGDKNGPTKIAASATKWDTDDLGPLRSRFRAEHIFLDPGEDATFDYVEPKEGGG
jgi:hypothetical protein